MIKESDKRECVELLQDIEVGLNAVAREVGALQLTANLPRSNGDVLIVGFEKAVRDLNSLQLSLQRHATMLRRLQAC